MRLDKPQFHQVLSRIVLCVCLSYELHNGLPILFCLLPLPLLPLPCCLGCLLLLLLAGGLPVLGESEQELLSLKAKLGSGLPQPLQGCMMQGGLPGPLILILHPPMRLGSEVGRQAHRVMRERRGTKVSLGDTHNQIGGFLGPIRATREPREPRLSATRMN